MFDFFGGASRKFHSAASGPRGSRHPGWPEATPAVRLVPSARFPHGARVQLLPLLRSDGPLWRRMRLEDQALLQPVEPTQAEPWDQAHSVLAWWNYLLYVRQAASDAQIVPLAIDVDGQFGGQLTLGNIQRGGIRECWIGYWVHSSFTGGSVATVACGLGTDHAFHRVGMHRVTATFLPENPASGKVLSANGYREEGYFRRNLHIDGRWRDHHFVALTSDDFSTTCVERLRLQGRIEPKFV